MPNLTRLLVLMVFATIGQAGVVNVGLISFEVLIPSGPTSPGVNVFQLSNLTGDPSAGGFALPPDFPAFTPITFLVSTLSVVSGGLTQTIDLGTIAPGPFASILLQFPDTTAFSMAMFSATMGGSPILLSGGGTFTPASTSINAVLAPSSGSSLVAGRDLAVVAVSDVEEPGTFGVLLSGVTAMAGLARKLRRTRDSRCIANH